MYVSEDGTVHLDWMMLNLILQVRHDIARAAGIEADFRILPDKDPNAFVTTLDGSPIMVLNAGTIELIGTDRDEYAFLFAHEYAHLSRQHLAEQKKRREKLGRIGGAIIGGIEFIGLAMGVPLGLASIFSVESGSRLVSLKYDRDQEREADEVAVALMQKAGYSPYGAISFHEKLLDAGKNVHLPIFSTHPAGEERIARLRALMPGTESGSPPEEERNDSNEKQASGENPQ